jgi:hypothetical protein
MRKRTEKTEEKQPIRLAETRRLRAALFPAERMRQMLMPPVKGAVEARRGLMAWSHQLGVEALQEIFRDDVGRARRAEGQARARPLLQPLGPGTDGARVRRAPHTRHEAARPRRRDGGEVTLPTVKQLQAFDPLPDTVLNQILLGVSTRGYDASVPPPPIGTRSRGTSRSAVSRQLVRKMGEKMKASLTSSLAEVRIPLDPGARSGVIRALVPVDLGAVGAKRRATSGSERSDG